MEVDVHFVKFIMCRKRQYNVLLGLLTVLFDWKMLKGSQGKEHNGGGICGSVC